MDRSRVTRRNVLTAGVALFVMGSGCTSGEPETTPQPSSTSTETVTDRHTLHSPTEVPPPSTRSSPSQPTTGETTQTEGPPISVTSVAVQNYVVYPLSSTHPTVHRQPGTQYVILKTEALITHQEVREHLDIRVNGEALPLADRQPVQRQTDTFDVAFALSKTQDVTNGDVLFNGTEVQSLSEPVIERLNNPPRFEISETVVSPQQIRAGTTETARLEVEVANTGEGPGTFAASLSGRASGSKELFVTVDPGDQTWVSGIVEIAGVGEEATLHLDWGSDQLVTEIPVIGTPSQ